MKQDLKIEKLAYGGDGIGFIETLPVFVSMTVPGDEIQFEPKRQHKSYLTGSLLRIVKPSINRIIPKCEHFGRCGGCQWQHIDYASQILWKQLILEEQLVHVGKVKNPNVLPTIPSPKIWNYRNRIKLHRDKDGKIGFYEHGTNTLVEIDQCLIAGPECIKGSPLFFTQINPEQNKNLQKLVALLAKEVAAKKILELYCGSGNLTVPLASVAKEITAVDSSKSALRHVPINEKIKFVCMSAGFALKRFCKDGFDCIVLDPPRDGCKDILKDIIKTGTGSIIYISCNPSTMARDVGTLMKNGYSLMSVQPIDMFPQTYHIESVTLLQLTP